MNFVLDNNLPPGLAKGLHALFERDYGPVHHLRHLGLAGEPDQRWLAGLRVHAEGRWSVITVDRRIKSRPQERAAWQDAGHVIFLLTGPWGNHHFEEVAWRLIRWWPKIATAADRASDGSLVFVPFQYSSYELKPWAQKSLRRAHNRRTRR